jgi:hypothetical protein
MKTAIAKISILPFDRHMMHLTLLTHLNLVNNYRRKTLTLSSFYKKLLRHEKVKAPGCKIGGGRARVHFQTICLRHHCPHLVFPNKSFHREAAK